MAPVAATIALSHVEGISDAARARELYKYVDLLLANACTNVLKFMEGDTKVHGSHRPQTKRRLYQRRNQKRIYHGRSSVLYCM